MVLSSTEHLSSIHTSGTSSERLGIIWRMSPGSRTAASGAADGALTTSGSSEANVCITDFVKHATVTVVIVASASAGARLAERDLGLEHGALHVVDEDGEVARL